MGQDDTDLDRLLGELLAARPPQRRACIAAAGCPREIVTALAERAEQLAIDDLHRALDATEMLASLADELGDAAARVRARRARAHTLAYANRFDEAIAVLTESAQLARSIGDDGAAARAGLTMVHAFARLGRFDEAVVAGEEALQCFTGLGQREWAAKAEVNLGVTHRMRNDPDRALRHFDRARPVLASDPVSLAQLDSNRADALLELNRFAEAEAAFTSALEAFERAGQGRAAAIVEGNLADVMSRQGRLQAALFHYERVRRRFEADGAEGDLARLKSEQAEAFAGAGLPGEAAGSYREAIPELDRHGLVMEAARARLGLGRTLTCLGALDDAAAALDEAAEQFAGLEHEAGGARVALLRGELAIARGDADAAAEHLTAALQGLGERPAEAAVARHHLAAIALAHGDPGRAEGLIAEALAAATTLNLAPLLADLLQTRARLWARQGRPDDALDDLRCAVVHVDRLRGTLQADRLRAAFVADRSTVYADLIAMLLDDPTAARVAEAFGVVEQARSRALLDLVAGAVHGTSSVSEQSPPVDGEDHAETPLVRRVLRLRGDLNGLYSVLAGAGASGDWSRWRDRVEACEGELQTLENRLAATRGVGGLFAAPADLSATQACLGPDTVLVEYFLAGDELVAFVVGPATVECRRRLASRGELVQHLELTRFQIERVIGYTRDEANGGLVADARRELRDLHAILIEPLGPCVAAARQLIFVPHGLLHGLPLHALHDGQAYLIEHHEVSYVPSASLLRHLDSAPRAAAGGERASLVFGVADSAAPHIGREVEAVAGLLPGSRVYAGADATWARLEAEGRGAFVVHLACHGWFLPDNPLAAGLRLADRWMTVRDLYGLRLDGAVVVVSGCDTGRSSVDAGDDLVGLVRGFFTAGASALLLSLWPLHDETGRILVASIYEFWQNGRSEGAHPDRGPRLAEAVRAAQRRVMESDPHPAFWAPFMLVGRPS